MHSLPEHGGKAKRLINTVKWGRDDARLKGRSQLFHGYMVLTVWSTVIIVLIDRFDFDFNTLLLVSLMVRAEYGAVIDSFQLVAKPG